MAATQAMAAAMATLAATAAAVAAATDPSAVPAVALLHLARTHTHVAKHCSLGLDLLTDRPS